MRRLSLSIMIILVFAWAGPVRADIDQHCLSLCYSTGKSGLDCLKQCTYNITPPNPQLKSTAVPAVTLESLEAHRELAVPLPATGDILPEPPKKPVAAAVDRTCLAQCLQQGLQYGLCSEQCVKTPCPANVVMCKREPTVFTPVQSHN